MKKVKKKTEKLKPCPFCGVTPIRSFSSIIECGNQGCHLVLRTFKDLSHEEAIKAWNTRKRGKK